MNWYSHSSGYGSPTFACCLLILVLCWIYTRALKVNEKASYKNAVDCQRTTKRYIAGDRSRQSFIYFSRSVQAFDVSSVFLAISICLICRGSRFAVATPRFNVPECTRNTWQPGRRWRAEVETTDSQSVCLGIEYHCGTCEQILFPVGILQSEICGLVTVGRPLWREDGSVICSVITQWSESPRTRNHIVLSYETPPTWRARVVQLYPWALGSLYVASYDSQGYGGGILTLPLPGGTCPSIYSLQE
jgi:hypothetical protein